MSIAKLSVLSFAAFLNILLFVSNVSANNLSINSVSLEERNKTAKTVVVKFNISWQNSWKTKINHDAVWLTVRLNNPSVSPAYKKLCQATSSGLNPSSVIVGTSADLEAYVPADKAGVFLRPAKYMMASAISSSDVRLTVDYNSCGFSDSETVQASVFGIEMVYVPQGAFYAGDYGQSQASLVQGSADTDPWAVGGESEISAGNPASNGYRYVSSGNASEDATGSSFAIGQEFPKGYKAFYTMKYEITEADWVEFVNSLPTDAARSVRDLTDGNHKNSDLVSYRNTINCSGTPLVCSTSRPSRAVGFLTWMDLAAFLDWTALRPMTELEFEKIARGPVLAVNGEYAWGSTDISAAANISAGTENGAETVDASSNANYNSTVFSGGDAVNGPDYAQGPVRTGIFALTSSSRETAGASYYGVLELSGNLRERVVTVGNAAGRVFTGVNGDGVLSMTSGYEGNANTVNWPGLDAVVARGVTGAEGSGFRGGSFSESSDRLRISDRSDAANASTVSFNNSGGRGVRTYDGD